MDTGKPIAEANQFILRDAGLYPRMAKIEDNLLLLDLSFIGHPEASFFEAICAQINPPVIVVVICLVVSGVYARIQLARARGGRRSRRHHVSLPHSD